MTTFILRFLPAAALAALGICVLEALYALCLGTARLPFAEVFGVVFGTVGVLGTTATLVGWFLLLTMQVIQLGWHEEREPTPGPRRVGWALYGVLAAVTIALVVYLVISKTIGVFKKPVYVALAGALTSAAAAALMAMLSRPFVRMLEAPFAAWENRGPEWLDPSKRAGAVVWMVLLVIVAAALAPIVIRPLHTVDLRPAWSLLLWGGLLASIAWWSGQWSERQAWMTVGTLGLVFVAGFAWSASSLGESQTRVGSLARDTVLTRHVLSFLSRVGDGDGDGVSSLFVGGDCDDSNPAVRPGVFDRPDDGIDQNCTGRDLVLKERIVPRPVRTIPKKKEPWHVVLLTIDALRADVVREHMPRLSALAEQSIDFSNAYSHGAATYWSLPALMTSKMPSRLEMGRDQTPVSRELMMTEVLRDHGWHTALFANVTVFFVRGLRQGAQTTNYDTSHFTVHGAKPGSAHLTDGLLRHVDKWKAGHLRPQRDQFFLWAHYYDPHDPYFEVPGFKATDNSDKARYLAIVRYVDQEIGRLIDGLKARGVWDRTLFILTSDHGDEFMEHGNRFHGSTLYEEMTHVPLILRVPGATPRRIKEPIGHVEVAPTVLDLLGVRIPQRYEGRSRVEQVRTGQTPQPEPVFFEVFPDVNYKGHQVGVRTGDLKLIHRLTDNYLELYDLAADPLERVNLIDTHPEADALRDLLGRYIDRHLFALAQGKSGARLPPGSPPKAKARPKKRRKARPKAAKAVKPPSTKSRTKAAKKAKPVSGSLSPAGVPAQAIPAARPATPQKNHQPE